ncbi:predicted protein [Uncinocarpus reesii 1704]|uniref:Uncharacterized protein n=1 Tax=Uncinocarpus reesii (strain UAMH 1704) TaxID=336963 RepID=C4JSV3_UNCRE|nr:uncharacterized protein UREG_05542 [Uncinocarpus reesii 1704]EEP80700.1 predicted protein [Uncinocarpus reesii 1704]
MGIPLVWEPTASRAEQNSKPDSSAIARSSIRRQNAIRRPRRNYGTVESRARNGRGSSTRWYRAEAIGAFARQADRELGSRDLRGLRVNTSPTEDPAAQNLIPPIARTQLRPQLSEDHSSSSSLGRRMQISRDPYLMIEMPVPLDSYSSFPPTAPPVPSVRHAATATGHIAFTPRFAPAHPTGELSARSNTGSPSTTLDIPGSNNVPSFRGLGPRVVRRVTDRRSGRRQEVDGLGDRERSPAPDEDEMHDSWETLLTTITPDDQLPSLDSSFASATASASSALSRSSGLSNSVTSLHTPMSSILSDTLETFDFDREFPDGLPDGLPNCEFSSSDSDSDTEPESELDTSPARLAAGSAEEEESDQSDSSYDPAQIASDIVSSSSRLEQAQMIIELLAMRSDIPDEWWATAGLSRTLRRELGITNTETQNS